MFELFFFVRWKINGARFVLFLEFMEFFFRQLYNNGSWHIFLLFNQSLIHITCGQYTYKFGNGIFHFLLPTCFEFLRMFLIYFRFENCIEDLHRAFWWICYLRFSHIEKWRIILCSHSMPLIRCVYLFFAFLNLLMFMFAFGFHSTDSKHKRKHKHTQ